MTTWQSVYFILLACSLATLVGFVFKMSQKEDMLSRISIVILGGSFAVATTHMMQLMSTNTMANSIYFITRDMVSICFMLYAMEFDNVSYSKAEYIRTSGTYQRSKFMVFFITTIDVVLLIFGFVMPKYAPHFASQSMFSPFIVLHNTAVFLPLIVGCTVLIQKRRALPSFYKKPYEIILVLTAYIVLCDIAYITSYGEIINLSIIGFPIEGAIMYYFSTPKRFDSLIRRSNDAVMDSLNDGFILLDKDHKIIYKNQSIYNVLPTDYEWNLIFDEFADNIKNGIAFNNKVYMIRSRDGNPENDRYVNISYQKISDERGKESGSYFLLHDSTDDEIRRRENEYRAKHNTLTGLYNKFEFCEQSKKHVLLNIDKEYILILIDIDKFKMINELFGNETGDFVLCKVGEAIRDYVGSDGVFGHLNDDKFMMLLQKKDFDEATFFRTLHKGLIIEQDKDYKIIIHAGICDVDAENYDEDELNISLFIDRSVLALADIKGNMRQRIAWYGPHITKTLVHQQKVISEVDKALENKSICFFVQPQTDIDGNSHGGEALVRWVDDERGIIPPSEFIPVLEEKGLISKVDLYVWDLVCQKLKEWKNKGWDDYYLSVNISAKDMYYMNIYDEFTALIDKYGIKPSMLKLEVTESAVMLDKGRQFEILERLRRFGFTIEIDDFGSGYSSLNMLKDIEFDMLKIDMAFLRETQHVEKSRNIIKSIIQMAKCIGTDVITEGVETADQLEFLNEAGCDNFQGYYFDKPLPVEQFEQKYLMKKRGVEYDIDRNTQEKDQG